MERSSSAPRPTAANASGDPAAGDSLSFRLGFSARLGREHATRVSAYSRPGSKPQTEVEVQRTSRGSDLGWTYRATVRHSGDGKAGGNASLHRETRAFRASLEGSLRDENADVLLRLEGAVAWIGGHLALARRLERSFALVEVPGQPGVEVLFQNRSAGRTGARGLLVLPALVPYQENRVQIDPTTLPIGLRFEHLERTVVPYAGGAARVTFEGCPRETCASSWWRPKASPCRQRAECTTTAGGSTRGSPATAWCFSPECR